MVIVNSWKWFVPLMSWQTFYMWKYHPSSNSYSFKTIEARSVTSPRNRLPIHPVIRGKLVSASMSLALFQWSRKFIFLLLIYFFSFVIDNAKPACLDCVNSNIYSCILWFLKWHWSFVRLMSWQTFYMWKYHSSSNLYSSSKF